MKGIIIYATKYGCTEKVVKMLQSKIPIEVKTVNVEKEKITDLTEFDIIILGGPIYIGKIPKKLSDFIQENREILKSKKLALFLCAGEQDVTNMENLLLTAYSEELYNHAITREVVGGELHLSKLDFITRIMLRVVKGIKKDYSRLSEAKINKLAKEPFNIR